VHPHKQTGDGTWIFSWLPHAGFKLHSKARANTYVQFTPDSDFELLPKVSDQRKLITAENRKLKDQFLEQAMEEQAQAKYKREVEHIAILRSAAVSKIHFAKHCKPSSKCRPQHVKAANDAFEKYLSQCKFHGMEAVPISPSEYMTM